MIREDMKYDVRTQKHRLRRREFSHAELAAHLKELPDDADECVETVTEFVAAFASRGADENLSAE